MHKKYTLIDASLAKKLFYFVPRRLLVSPVWSWVGSQQVEEHFWLLCGRTPGSQLALFDEFGDFTQQTVIVILDPELVGFVTVR